jgi:hypothetical protein
VAQGTEKVQSLENLSTKQELNDDPTTNFRMRCPVGTKSVRGTCVDANATVNIDLNSSVSLALDKVQNMLLTRQGVK